MTTPKKFPLPVLGVDVLSNETSMVPKTVRTAVNVDVGRAGDTARRAGYQRVVAEGGMHSLYYSRQKGTAFVARDAVLQQLDLGTYGLTPFFAMKTTDLIDYTEYNGNLYFTNRSRVGWIPANSAQPRVVGLPVPQPPTLSVADGGLTAGTYAVVTTVVDDRGEESPASTVRTIELPNGGGIRMSGLPQAAGATVCAYITAPDGDQLRLAAQFPAVFPTYVVAEVPYGDICSTQFLTPLPPGDFIRWHNGRLFTARDGVLRFSVAGRPHLHDPAHGVIPFVGAIAFIEPVVDGIYVGDDRGVWFLSGADPVKFDQRLVSPSRAVARSSITVLPEHFDEKTVPSTYPVALWLSTSGYIAGMPGGNVAELHADRVRIPTGLAGRSVFLLRNGRKQVITPVNSATVTAAGSAVDSTIP